MEEDDLQGKLRRTYGRGYRDGMKADKLKRIEESITPTAKKVLAAVPIKELWTVHQIIAEMVRNNIHMNYPVVVGCLSSLKDSKLVREHDGRWQRVEAKLIKLFEAPEPEEKTQMSPTQQMPSLKDLVGRAEALAKLLRNAADEVETIALEFDKALQQEKNRNSELEQLSSLIKKLSKGE